MQAVASSLICGCRLSLLDSDAAVQRLRLECLDYPLPTLQVEEETGMNIEALMDPDHLIKVRSIDLCPSLAKALLRSRYTDQLASAGQVRWQGLHSVHRDRDRPRDGSVCTTDQGGENITCCW